MLTVVIFCVILLVLARKTSQNLRNFDKKTKKEATVVYTVGNFWMVVYGIAAILSLVGGFLQLADWYESKKPKSQENNDPYSRHQKKSQPTAPWGVGLFFLAILLVYFAFYAGMHFRVEVNTRALLIDTVHQKPIGTREAGVQPKPLIGVKPIGWPAARSLMVFLDLQPGTASATSDDNIALWVDAKVFLDLFYMDLEGAYTAVNGAWEKFFKDYLETQLMNIIRDTSKEYTVVDHVIRREEWAREFEKLGNAFLEKEGYGVVVVPGRTTMSFDFVNEEDAKAFDEAQRAAFLITKRQHEQSALNIEAQMADTRAGILVKTSQGAIDSWQKVVDFIQDLPLDTRAFLEEFMTHQTDLEYLRLVSQLEPETFFPPGGGGAVPTFSVNPQQTQEIASETPQE